LAKRTIIFRADGGPSIGMGHFTRTLALAEMLNEHFHCIFATRHPTEYQIAEIEKICHEIIDLPEDDTHFERFLDLENSERFVHRFRFSSYSIPAAFVHRSVLYSYKMRYRPE